MPIEGCLVLRATAPARYRGSLIFEPLPPSLQIVIVVPILTLVSLAYPTAQSKATVAQTQIRNNPNFLALPRFDSDEAVPSYSLA